MASARPCATMRTVSAMVSVSPTFALGRLSFSQSTVQLPRMSARVNFASFSAFQSSTLTLSVVSTAMTSVCSGTVNSMSLARSAVRVSAPSEISILSATRKGTRWGVSVGTNSAFTPSDAAILLPTSMSKPSQFPSPPRELMGGKFGLMPIRIVPALMMSSSDLAWAVARLRASAASNARQGKAILFNMRLLPEKRARESRLYCCVAPDRRLESPGQRRLDGDVRAGFSAESTVYSMSTKIPADLRHWRLLSAR